MDERNGPRELSIGQPLSGGRHRQLLLHRVGEESQIVLVKLGLDPYGGQIDHVVQRRTVVHEIALALILRDDVAVNRRGEGQLGIDLARAQKLLDVRVVHIVDAQPLPGHVLAGAIAALPRPLQILQRLNQFRTVANIDHGHLLALVNRLTGVVDEQLDDASFLAGGDVGLLGFVELDKADGANIVRQRLITEFDGFDAGDGDLVRSQLDAADDAGRQRLPFHFFPLFPSGKGHGAEGALIGVIADDGGVHRTPVFAIGADGGFLTEHGPRPLVIPRREQVPLGDDKPDGGQHGEETQPRELHQHEEVEPPPGFSQEAESWRRARPPSSGGPTSRRSGSVVSGESTR